MEGRGDQDKQTKLWLRQECQYIPEVGQWTCVAGLASWKQTACSGFYWQRWRKRHLPDQWLPNQVPGDALICSSNEISSSVAATFEVTTGLSLMIIHGHSPSSSICLLDISDRWIEWGCSRNHHPCILHAFDDGTNLCNLSKDVALLLVYYFPR